MRRAYQLIFAGVAALSATGVALAQDRAGEAFFGHSASDDIVSYGLAPPPPQAPWMKRQISDGLKSAVPQMRLACAADRQSLCADKTSDPSADRCLQYYRLRVSSSCKQALIQVDLALRGAL